MYVYTLSITYCKCGLYGTYVKCGLYLSTLIGSEKWEILQIRLWKERQLEALWSSESPNWRTFPTGTHLPIGTQFPIGTNLPNGTQFPIGTNLPNGTQFPIGTLFPTSTHLLFTRRNLFTAQHTQVVQACGA